MADGSGVPLGGRSSRRPTDPAGAKPLLVLAAGITLTTMLGSVHAFSVFLEPLEESLAASRGQISLIYSGALVSLTVAVLLGYRIYGRWSPPVLMALVAVGAAIGVVVAGLSGSFGLTFLGYGVIFGGANGVGYGFALQFSAQAMPGHRGLAMGAVTAFYAFGAAIAPFLFNAGLGRAGLRGTFLATAVVFLVLGSGAAGLLRRSSFSFLARPAVEAEARRSTAPSTPRRIGPGPLLWLGYGMGALAGLMVIGHATGIIEAAGGSRTLAVAATAAMAAGNMAGGLGAGVLADRLPLGRLLIALPLLSMVVLLVSSTGGSPWLLVGCLVAVGTTYGAIIAAYPVAVLAVAGPMASSWLYGRVFTSWGAAGLAGPWLAGVLFDTTGRYRLSFVVAAACAACSVASAVALTRRVDELR